MRVILPLAMLHQAQNTECTKHRMHALRSGEGSPVPSCTMVAMNVAVANKQLSGPSPDARLFFGQLCLWSCMASFGTHTLVYAFSGRSSADDRRAQ